MPINLGALVNDVETLDANWTYTIVDSPTKGGLSGTGSDADLHAGSGQERHRHVHVQGERSAAIRTTAGPRARPVRHDGSKTSAVKTVTITISEVNNPPVAVDDSKSVAEDGTLTFPASDLDTNDSAGPANESGQTLTVVAVASTPSTHGSVSLVSGQITYTPAANYSGPASFSYTVRDNGTTNGAPDPEDTGPST